MSCPTVDHVVRCQLVGFQPVMVIMMYELLPTPLDRLRQMNECFWHTSFDTMFCEFWDHVFESVTVSVRSY